MHVASVVRDIVDSERNHNQRHEMHNLTDSELIDRLGSSYAVVAELVLQLMERQRSVVRLRRELNELRRHSKLL